MSRTLLLSSLGFLLVATIGACDTADEHADAEQPSDHHAHDEAEHVGHDDDPGHDEHEEGGHDDDEGGVQLTERQMAEFGVTVSVAGPGVVDMGVELPCEVRPNGDRLAHIVPRFPGIVTDVRKSIGDAVRTGDVLAVIESSDSLTPYSLTTLIDGTVIEKHLTKGEAVDRDKQAFAIADLSSVWVDCSVFQKDLDRVSIGKAVRVSAGDDDDAADGIVSYLTPVVDQPTRTATARTVLENADGRWRPGMFVSVRVLEPVSVALAVAHSSLQTLGADRVVFVEQGEGGFLPRPVALGRSGATEVEVVSGLEPGERYVATNSFLLKAELGKGSAEHEH